MMPDSNRVTHACDRCRRLRTKCSGGRTCQKCSKDQTACAYGDRKRERYTKDLSESLDRIKELEQRNLDLKAALETSATNKSQESEKEPDTGCDFTDPPAADVINLPPDNQVHKKASPNPTPPGQGPKHNERPNMFPEAGLGSGDGELDRAVDLDHGTGLVGIVGKTSPLAWIQHVHELMAKSSDTGSDVARADVDEHPIAANAVNYFVDDTNILSVDEDKVDPLEWPELRVALILTEAAMYAMHDDLRFVLREEFLQRLAEFSVTGKVLSQKDRRWLGIANLVWAIGSKWLGLTMSKESDFFGSHMLYYARARALGLDHRIVFDHPDLSQVQSMGLLVFYLLVNGSISRAWSMSGAAIRHAIALGLHLKVTDSSVIEGDRRRRAETWFSLQGLEISIAEITGRPRSISSIDVMSPTSAREVALSPQDPGHPVFSNDLDKYSRRIWSSFWQSTPDIWRSTSTNIQQQLADVSATKENDSLVLFWAQAHLRTISDRIAMNLYTGTRPRSWYDIDQQTKILEEELRVWSQSLVINSKTGTDVLRDANSRATMALNTHYHSVQMMLYHVHFCDAKDLHHKMMAQEFHAECATRCLGAAMAMLHLIPAHPCVRDIYDSLPWWTLMHYLCQAGAILAHELCLENPHAPNSEVETLSHLEKVVVYLWHMRDGSRSAYQAWSIFNHIFLSLRKKVEWLKS